MYSCIFDYQIQRSKILQAGYTMKQNSLRDQSLINIWHVPRGAKSTTHVKIEWLRAINSILFTQIDVRACLSTLVKQHSLVFRDLSLSDFLPLHHIHVAHSRLKISEQALKTLGLTLKKVEKKMYSKSHCSRALWRRCWAAPKYSVPGYFG